MDLKELKREVERLPNVHKNVEGLHAQWVRHVKEGRSSFVSHNTLPVAMRRDVGQKVAVAQEHLEDIKEGQLINERLASNARCLIDLKLAQFQGDKNKASYLGSRLLNDEFMGMKNIIHEIQGFQDNVQKFSEVYHDVNELLHKQLSLEETLFLMDLPHKMFVHNLLKTAQQQKMIVRDLGRHFVAITKEMSLKNYTRR